MSAMASRLSAQAFVQAHIKENIKAPRHGLMWQEYTGMGNGRAGEERSGLSPSWDMLDLLLRWQPGASVILL